MHPCENKCDDFKGGECCAHCLVQDLDEECIEYTPDDADVGQMSLSHRSPRMKVEDLG